MDNLEKNKLKKELLNLNLKLVLCKDKNEVWNLIDDAFEIENKLYMKGKNNGTNKI
jgi:hypothetical protein